MKTDIHEEIIIPERVQVHSDETFVVKGPRGEIKKKMRDPAVKLVVGDGKVSLDSARATKNEKKKVYTFVAHIKNMFRGVLQGYFYELKVCAAHFPINVTVAGKELIVKNFLGESAPRKLLLREGVNVKVNGDIIRIESPDKELAGMTSSEIELLTKIRNRDRRVFQDGIFIIRKGVIESR